MRAAASVSALALAAAAASVSADPSTCNGFAQLCSAPYNSASYATTHNAYAVGPYPAANQLNPVGKQLEDGIRALMLDIMYPTSSPSSASSSASAAGGTGERQIYLCHTDCALLSAGPLVDTLRVVADFLQKNRGEVVTIFFENHDVPAADVGKAFRQAGLDALAFPEPPSPEGWPTLGEMVTQNKRLVVFTDTEADTSVVNWLLPEYTYVWETPYQVLVEGNFTCDVDRPKGQVRPMFVLNHFVYGEIQLGSTAIPLPLPNMAQRSNSASSLAAHARQCAQSAGHNPNFVAVDFYQNGDVLQVVAELNNITDFRPPPGVGSAASGSVPPSSSAPPSAIQSRDLAARAVALAAIFASAAALW